MKKLLLLFSLTLLIFSCGSQSNAQSTKVEKANPETYASTITAGELKTMLYKYASDEFEGRDTGEKGQKLAVDYLKNQYKALEIPTPLGDDNYFQKVPLEKQKVAEAQLSVNGKVFQSFEDHVVVASNSINLSVTEIVYVGYGIDSEIYSDYNNIDVQGKIVLAKAGEPKDAEGNFVTSGNQEQTKWTSERQSLSSKRDAAVKNGAKGFLYLDTHLFSRYAPYLKRQFKSGTAGRLALKENQDGMMMLLLNDTLAAALHPTILSDNSTKSIETNLSVAIENNSDEIMSENVVAYIKGSEKADEVLVISAHLDHEGIKNGEIYNGADDDGSGTVAILEIAEAFKMAEKAGHGPKRSILFLHVTGEEKGLLGSKQYADNDPIFPLENTVANLNIDMIGRTDPKRKEGTRNYIYLIGSDKLSTDLHNISEEVNKTYINLELDYTFNDDNDPNRFYYRSDHYNFAKHNIPVIFYFNGTHKDYHKPTDTADKIEYDLLETRTRLIFLTAWEVANRAERVVVDKAN